MPKIFKWLPVKWSFSTSFLNYQKFYFLINWKNDTDLSTQKHIFIFYLINNAKILALKTVKIITNCNYGNSLLAKHKINHSRLNKIIIVNSAQNRGIQSWIAMQLIMVALWNRADHYIFALWFLLLLSYFLSSPNLSRRRLDVCHTSTHGVALVQI